MSNAPRLSVNLNKVALIRNSRHTGVPDLLTYAALAREAGADGITLHPRPDQRHVRSEDVFRLAEWMKPWRPGFELNIEGYPDDRLLEIVAAVRPEQCTLVPDVPTAFTSEEGWKLDGRDAPVLRSRLPGFRRASGRVVLFIDPDPAVVPRIPETGVDGVEIYTGAYAAAFREGGDSAALRATVETAVKVSEAGLRINIGHDLNLKNLPPLVRSLPPIAEASIGHELTADALIMGFPAAVRAYKRALASSTESQTA